MGIFQKDNTESYHRALFILDNFPSHRSVVLCIDSLRDATKHWRINQQSVLTCVEKLLLANNASRAKKLIEAVGPLHLRQWWLITRGALVLAVSFGMIVAVVGMVIFAVRWLGWIG